MTRIEPRSYWPLVLIVVLAVAYRLYLTPQYFGWEESDYGNLAMTRGVLDSGFAEYDMRHLPLYYFISAVIMAVVGDAIVATHLVSLLCGTLAVVFAYLISRRVFDRWTALVAGLLLCFQPEYALYSSTSLRDPLFTCLVLAGCYALFRGHPRLAAVLTGFSFLTRFDSLATNMSATVLHLARRPPGIRSIRNPVWGVLLVFAAFVLAWSAYCGRVHGTYLFFLPTVAVNIETGGAQEVTAWPDFIKHGIWVSGSLFFGTLPVHLGRVTWAFALLGLLQYRSELSGRTSRGTLFAYLLINTLFWLAVGFIGQHEPGHNLYWVWMHTLTAFWVMFASAGFVGLIGRLKGRLWVSWMIAAIASSGIAVDFYRQTTFQLRQSAQLYRPQVELAQWVEAHVPPRTALIFDNIPACYINRKHHEWQFISWFDVPVAPGDREGMRNYLLKEQIRYVLWFKEDWTQAPIIAPYLAEPATHRLDGVTLLPLFHEEGYGFIFYEVDYNSGAEQ